MAKKIKYGLNFDPKITLKPPNTLVPKFLNEKCFRKAKQEI